MNEGEFNMHKQTRLSNKHVQMDRAVGNIFQDRVEVELQKNLCKVFGFMPRTNQSRIGADLALPKANLTT